MKSTLQLEAGSNDVNIHCDFLKLFLEVHKFTSFVGIYIYIYKYNFGIRNLKKKITSFLEKKLCCIKRCFLIIGTATGTSKNFQKFINFLLLVE
jgi:hypothetical protein